MAVTGIPVAANAAEATDQKHYVIPAQPLTQALAEFARVSGVDIFYEAGLASGHRSAAIDGRYTPATALRALLAGTGLSARFTGRKAAIVFSPSRPPPVMAEHASTTPSLQLDMAQVRAPILIGKPDTSSFDAYARTVQHEIRTMLNGDAGIRGSAFRVAIAVRVDRAGRIDSIMLAPGSKAQDRGTEIRAVLVGRALSQPPPEGAPQPFRFEVNSVRTSSQDHARSPGA